MDFKGKKLLILAGQSVHNKVVRAAKEMGVYTIVTDYLPIEKSPAKQLADEAWMLNITDVDGIVKRCIEENVDGVLNFCCDPAQKPYYEICNRLNLPCIGTKESFSILTDKIKFKDYCIKHDVDVIPEYSIDDIQFDRVQYPVLVKPSDSRGSRGQTICYTKAEALKAVDVAKKESSCSEFICEKYMGKYQDIASAFFCVDGEPYLVKFGDRYLGRKEDNLDRQVMCTKLPSDSSDLFESFALGNVKKMIKSLGIKYGPVFLQGFVDGNTIRYYDPGERMPGGDYDLVLEKATGFSTIRSMIHFALTGDIKYSAGNPNQCYRLNGKTALLLTVSVRPGKIDKILGFDDVCKLPYVIYGRQNVSEGAVIPNTGDVAQRVAAFGLLIHKGDDITKCTEYIYETYRVLDKDGNNMPVSEYHYKQVNQ